MRKATTFYECLLFLHPCSERERGVGRSWSVLSFLAFLFQLGLQDEGEADGGWGAKSSALAYSSD